MAKTDTSGVSARPTIRYDEYHHSRAGDVVKQLIGDEFAGVLGSDFYAGYNLHQGLHQRCSGSFLARYPRAQTAAS